MVQGGAGGLRPPACCWCTAHVPICCPLAGSLQSLSYVRDSKAAAVLDGGLFSDHIKPTTNISSQVSSASPASPNDTATPSAATPASPFHAFASPDCRPSSKRRSPPSPEPGQSSPPHFSPTPSVVYVPVPVPVNSQPFPFASSAAPAPAPSFCQYYNTPPAHPWSVPYNWSIPTHHMAQQPPYPPPAPAMYGPPVHTSTMSMPPPHHPHHRTPVPLTFVPNPSPAEKKRQQRTAAAAGVRRTHSSAVPVHAHATASHQFRPSCGPGTPSQKTSAPPGSHQWYLENRFTGYDNLSPGRSTASHDMTHDNCDASTVCAPSPAPRGKRSAAPAPDASSMRGWHREDYELDSVCNMSCDDDVPPVDWSRVLGGYCPPHLRYQRK